MPDGKIFINYRRRDTAGYARSIYDRLNRRFPGRVFMDVHGIEVGEDFVRKIEETVGACAALVALVGPQWLTLTDDKGARRLDNPEDLVRLEIVAALKRSLPIIPALVGDARMPAAAALPADLTAFAHLNALDLRDDDFDHDVDRLVAALERKLGETAPLPLNADDEQQRRALAARNLRQDAEASIISKDWTTAIQSLQAALSLDNSADNAARLRWALERQQLAGLRRRAQQLCDQGDRQGALQLFRQLRLAGGDYENLDAVIAKLEGELAPPAPVPSPAPRGFFGTAAVSLVSLVVVGGILVVFLVIALGLYSLSQRTSTEGVANTAGTTNNVSTFASTPDAPRPSVSTDGNHDAGREAATDTGEPPTTVSDAAPEPAADSFFEPVGSWIITYPQAEGLRWVMRLNRDHSCRIDAQIGTATEGGDGNWSYDPATRLLRLRLSDAEAGEEETLRIDRRAGNQYFAVSQDLGEVALTRQ